MNSASSSGDRLFTFVAGVTGPWQIDRVVRVAGEALAVAPRLAVLAGPGPSVPSGAVWSLRGTTSNERYVERAEKKALVARQEGLGRELAIHAALIPIRKTATWWGLAQDERREIFEAQSRHIATGLRYLPAIARRLHHCRDLATTEPFDFLTWFEFASGDAAAFGEMLDALRRSPEWTFVERESEVRLSRVGDA